MGLVPTAAGFPDFFIVGAPRSGTTSLFEALRQHPALFMPERKEPHHFCPDLDSGSYLDSLYFTRRREDYLALFQGAGSGQLTGEASTSYLLSRESARLIHDVNPEARILVMLRHPIQMFESFHSRRYLSGAEDLADLREALAAEEDRRAGRRIPETARNVPALQYRAVARYGEQLQRFVEQFPQDRIHAMVFDDFRLDPMATYRDAYRFLGVDPAFEPNVAVENAARQVRRRTVHRLLFSPGLVAIGRRLMPAALARRVRPLINRAITSPGSAQRLSAAERATLRAELLTDIRLLGALLGRDMEADWL